MSDFQVGLLTVLVGVSVGVALLAWLKPWRLPITLVRGTLRVLSLIFLALAVTLDRQVRTTFSETLAQNQELDTERPTWDTQRTEWDTVTTITEGALT